MKKSLLFAPLAVLTLVGAGCGTSTPTSVNSTNTAPVAETKDTSPISIGWVGPLTGDTAALGTDAMKAAQLAVDDVNTAGGVNGRMLKLVAEDGRCDGKTAASAINKLVNADGVSAIVGGLCSGETMAMAPVVESAHKPLISYCSSAPTVTNAGDYVFRTYPSDSYQGAFIADYVYNKMGKRRAAVVAILGDWGNGIKQVFTQKFTELGGKVVISEDYAQDSRDLSAQMVKVKTSDAEIMLFLGYTEASIAGLKQAKDLGITIPVFGGDAWDDQKIRESGLQEGALYSAADINVSDAAWKEKLAAKGGNATVCTPRSYDNVKILADVMGRVGTDGEKMKNELYNLKDYPGVAGSLSFDQNGDLTTAGYKVFTVKDKKSEEVK